MCRSVFCWLRGLLLVLLFPVCGRAQQYSMVIHRVDNVVVPVSGIADSAAYSSPETLLPQLRRLVPALQELGYLAASLDSIGVSGGTRYDVYLYTGQLHKWARLDVSGIPQALLIAAAVNPAQWTGRPLRPAHVARLSEQILSYCEENGYPFARVWLDGVTDDGNGHVSAALMVDRAELRHIDTVIINGDVKIARAFLLRYLEINDHSIYNEKKLRAISQHIRELPFLEEAGPWSINFKPGDTRLQLYLKEKKANQFNALLGLMPNNLETGKLLLTADIQLALQNLLGRGESISASYQNLQYRSPRMKADILYPYIFHSPVGVEAHFDFFRNDLLFRKVSLQAGLRYQVSTTDFIRLYYQVQSNRIINVDTATILATHQLPDNIDSRAHGLGLEWNMQRTDYRINPHKGWQARIGVTGLQRNVIRNAGITGINDGSGFDFAALYDTITKTTYQYQAVAELAAYLPLAATLTLKLSYNGGYIVTERIFRNELFQIGGFRLLRGFDEQSIFANQYHVAVAELRLNLSRNSYAYLFSDNGYVQTKFNGYDRSALYNGFGLGTTLETKTGLFTIAYALGRSDYNPLRFRESKILFGYVAYF